MKRAGAGLDPCEKDDLNGGMAVSMCGKEDEIEPEGEI